MRRMLPQKLIDYIKEVKSVIFINNDGELQTRSIIAESLKSAELTLGDDYYLTGIGDGLKTDANGILKVDFTRVQEKLVLSSQFAVVEDGYLYIDLSELISKDLGGIVKFKCSAMSSEEYIKLEYNSDYEDIRPDPIALQDVVIDDWDGETISLKMSNDSPIGTLSYVVVEATTLNVFKPN